MIVHGNAKLGPAGRLALDKFAFGLNGVSSWPSREAFVNPLIRLAEFMLGMAARLAFAEGWRPNLDVRLAVALPVLLCPLGGLLLPRPRAHDRQMLPLTSPGRLRSSSILWPAMLAAVVHHLVESPCQRRLRPGGRVEARARLIRGGRRGPAAV